MFLKAFEQTEGSESRRCARRSPGPFRGYFIESLKLSARRAVLGGLIGTLLALVVVRLQRPRWLRNASLAFSGVAANMGGVILAFIFIATLGAQGLATKILDDHRHHELPPGSSPSFWGLVTVYLFFQIPLMFLVMLPAVDGLKPAWREAVANLGGTAVHVLAAGRRSRCSPRRRSAGCCCCSPTPSPPTPRRIALPPSRRSWYRCRSASTSGQHDHRQGQRRLRAGGVDDRA